MAQQRGRAKFNPTGGLKLREERERKERSGKGRLRTD